jgi:hypothetical protein
VASIAIARKDVNHLTWHPHQTQNIIHWCVNGISNHDWNATHSLKWCSFCNDFGEHLILCAGCAVGVCSASRESNLGCLIWDPIIERDDFIFYCTYCVRSRKTKSIVCVLHTILMCRLTSLYSQLSLRRESIPSKQSVWFRYDSPVLIIAGTSPESSDPFVNYFHHRLAMGYCDSTDLVSACPLCQADGTYSLTDNANGYFIGSKAKSN